MTALIAVLLLLSLVLLSFSSCSFLGGREDDGEGDDGTITTTALGSSSVFAPPASALVHSVEFVQNASPEIPAEAGTYMYVAEVASPSVVSILTEAIVYDRYNSYVASGAGSGVVCHVDTENGRTYIITNNHVVEGYTTVSVCKNGSNTELAATVIGTDWQTDLAVICVNSADFVPATFGRSDTLKVGQEVVAIGNPLGTLGGTVTNGIIGALEREIEVEGVKMSLVQHSAPVSPGNSGGGLFNLYGQLIGIVNAKSTGTGVEGLGYAIPIDLALERVGQIMTKGYVSGTPFLGISYGTSSNGITVSSYAYNSELEASGQETLKSGDILYSLNGVPITEESDVRKVLSGTEVGDRVEAVIYRANRFSYVPFTVSLTVHEYVPDWATGSSSDAAADGMEFN